MPYLKSIRTIIYLLYRKLNYPQYPNFIKVSIYDKKIFDKYNKKSSVYSDFLFENLLNWGIGNQIDSEYSFLYGNLIIRFRDNHGDKKITSILGKNNLNKTCSILLKREPSLNYVPEDIANKLDINTFDITEDRNNSDYIINIDQIINKKNEPIIRRKKIKDFINSYPTLEVKKLDLNDTKIQKKIFNLYKAWIINKKIDINTIWGKSLKCEFESLKRFFKYINLQNYIAIGIYDKNDLIGFNIGIKSTKGYIIGAFSKSTLTYKNLFVYMVYLFSIEAKYHQGKYINMDVDLGHEGLREAKLSWKPKIQKKYTVIAKRNYNQ